MKSNKKEIYKRLLNNLLKTKCISKSTKNIMSEKGGRLLCKKLELFGYILFECKVENHKQFNLTDKGKDLLNKLSSFSYSLNEREIFR